MWGVCSPLSPGFVFAACGSGNLQQIKVPRIFMGNLSASQSAMVNTTKKNIVKQLYGIVHNKDNVQI
jgi:hypothetical protein